MENNSLGQSYSAWQEKQELRKRDPVKYAELIKEEHELLANAAMTGVSVASIALGPELLVASSVVAGGFGAGSEIAGQLIENGGDVSKLDKLKVSASATIGVLTKNAGVIATSAANAGVEVVDTIRGGKEKPLVEGGIAFVSSYIGGGLGKLVEIPLDKKLNPVWKIKYSEKKGNLPYGISESYKPSNIPSILGNTIDNTVSPVVKEYIKGKNDAKK